MSRKVLALLATASVFLSPSAWASFVYYNVEVVSFGKTYQGSFAFDSSVVKAGETVSQTGLLSQLSLDLSGIPNLGSYDANTANTGSMSFDSAGMLSAILFGSNCEPGACTNTAGQHWSIAWNSAGPGVFTYFVAAGDGRYSGTAEVSPVPLPGTLGLLSFGLAGLGLIRRRKAG